MNYTKIKKIGEGGFGVVNLARRDTGDLIAIKEFKKTNILQCEVIRELNFISLINHENCTKVKYVIANENNFNLIMDYAGTSLRTFIKDSSYIKRINLCYDVLSQITKGLNYLHKNNIYHRDIKPDNILIDKNNIVKICDFGHCVEGRKDNYNTPNVCTPYYRAPELFSMDNSYDESIDIWSLGCTMYEYMLKKPIFKCGSDINVLTKILKCVPTSMEDLELLQLDMINPNIINKQQYHKLPNILKDSITDTEERKRLVRFKKILEAMLVINPNIRVKAKKILKWLEIEDDTRDINVEYKILRQLIPINEKRRIKALGFLYKCKLKDKTFFKAMAIIDYLCELTELTGAMIYASVNIASKYHDVKPVDITKLQDKVMICEITNAEVYIMRKLLYKVNFPTVYDFVQNPYELIENREMLIGVPCQKLSVF